MAGRPLYNLPNATTVESGDKFLIQQGVSSKQVDKDVLLTAENTSWETGKSVGYSLDDQEAFKQALLSEAGKVDTGLPDNISDSQRVDAIVRLLANTPKNALASGIPMDGSVRTTEINAVLSAGKDLYLPTGSVKASGLVPLNSSHMVGDGTTNSIITPAAINTNVMNFNNGQADTLIKDVWFEGLGYPSATTENGIVYDGTQNCRRNSIENVRFNGFSGAALRFSAGWGNSLKKVNINSSLIGIDYKVSPLLAGWSGSSALHEEVYVATCDVGLKTEAIYNLTSINGIFEDCRLPIKQVQSATPQVYINPWFESNAQSPEFRQSTVIIGGRKEGGEAPVAGFYDDVSLPSAPFDDECITDISKGVTVFRDFDSQIFRADGQGIGAFKPSPALGWDILNVAGSTAKKLSVGRGANAGAGGVTSETWGNDLNQWNDYNKLVARRTYNSFDVDLMNEYGVKIQAQGTPSGGGIGFVRTVISTGQYQTGGAGSTQGGDRWMWDEVGNYTPMVDGVHSIGLAGFRVKDLRIVNAPIVGSDCHIKHEPREIRQELLDFAMAVPMQEYELIGRKRTHYGIVITPEFLKSLATVTSIDGCGAFCKDVFTDANGEPVLEYIGGTTSDSKPTYSENGFYIEIPENCNVLIDNAQYRVLEGKCDNDDIIVSDGKLYAKKHLTCCYNTQLQDFEAQRYEKLVAPDNIRASIIKQHEILHNEKSGIEELTHAMHMRDNAISMLPKAELDKQEAMLLTFTFKPVTPNFLVTSGGVLLGELWQVRYDEWQNILLEAQRRSIIKLKETLNILEEKINTGY